jgi:hypothetical protein
MSYIQSYYNELSSEYINALTKDFNGRIEYSSNAKNIEEFLEILDFSKIVQQVQYAIDNIARDFSYKYNNYLFNEYQNVKNQEIISRENFDINQELNLKEKFLRCFSEFFQRVNDSYVIRRELVNHLEKIGGFNGVSGTMAAGAVAGKVVGGLVGLVLGPAGAMAGGLAGGALGGYLFGQKNQKELNLIIEKFDMQTNLIKNAFKNSCQRFLDALLEIFNECYVYRVDRINDLIKKFNNKLLSSSSDHEYKKNTINIKLILIVSFVWIVVCVLFYLIIKH